MFLGKLGPVTQPRAMFSSLKWECCTGVIYIRQFQDYLCVLSRPTNSQSGLEEPQVLCYKLRTGLLEEWQSRLWSPLHSKVWFLSEKEKSFIFPLANRYPCLIGSMGSTFLFALQPDNDCGFLSNCHKLGTVLRPLLNRLFNLVFNLPIGFRYHCDS